MKLSTKELLKTFDKAVDTILKNKAGYRTIEITKRGFELSLTIGLTEEIKEGDWNVIWAENDK